VLDDNKKVTMKIAGVMMHLMVEMIPEIYCPCVMCENDKKVLHVTALSSRPLVVWDARRISALMHETQEGLGRAWRLMSYPDGA